MNNSQAIHKQMDCMVDAFNRADADAAAEFLTEDAVGMPPNQPAIMGKGATHAYWAEGFRIATSRLEILSDEPTILGDWAIARYKWTMETRPVSGSPAASDLGKGLWICHRETDGSWKMATAIWNSDNAVTATIWSGAAAARARLEEALESGLDIRLRRPSARSWLASVCPPGPPPIAAVASGRINNP